MNVNEMKELCGRAAADALVKSGMKLGLGTGSTAVHAVRRVGELLKEKKIKDIKAFATSFQTEIECEKAGIPFYPLNSRELGGRLDLTIDGADEIDGENRCVKGGGGALLIEKIAAYASASYCLTADAGKIVPDLALSFPLPVEVVPEARRTVTLALEVLLAKTAGGGEIRLREAVRKAGPVITEHGNLLLDVRFNRPVDPPSLEDEINHIPGVAENGFFTKIRPVVYIALPDGRVEIRN
jgi:ribose 5-phosphate isomerase A